MKRGAFCLCSQTLRARILLLFLFFTAFVIIIQLSYSARLYSDQGSRAAHESQVLIGETNQKLDGLVENIIQIGTTISNNEVVQQYLLLDSTGPGTVLKRADLRKMMENYMDVIADANRDIRDIAIVSATEEITSCGSVFGYNTFADLKRKRNMNHLKRAFFNPLNDELPLDGFLYVVPVFYTQGAYSADPPQLGIAVIWCSEKALMDLIGTALAPRSISAITDADGGLIALSPEDSNARIRKTVQKIGMGQFSGSTAEIYRQKILSEDSYVMIRTNVSTGWNFISVTSVKGVYEEAARSLYLSICVSVITIAVALMMTFRVIRSIVRPMTAVIESIGRLRVGDDALRVEEKWVGRFTEFGAIVGSVNKMLSGLKKLNARALSVQKKLYQTELMQKEADLLALQGKIDPHFLNNTLECIRSIAVIRGARGISTITTSMAGIFRYSTADQIYTTVREELSCIADYEKIMAVRFNGSVRIRVEVEESLLSVTMLKMSLQPLVENAICHGIRDSEEGISIRISGRSEGNFAVFRVEDDGVGMSAGQLSQLRRMLASDGNNFSRQTGGKSTHIGLANIQSRIRLHFGKESGLTISSVEGNGTTVLMRIPLQSPPDALSSPEEALCDDPS